MRGLTVLKKLQEKLNWMFSGTAQISHQVCQFFVGSICLLVRVTMDKNKVNWGNCGIPWVNCTVLCVKVDWKGQFWGLRYCLSKLRSLLSFSVGMTSHSKIAQFNWECIAPFIKDKRIQIWVDANSVLLMPSECMLLTLTHWTVT
jgi:hypothetical protein